MAGEKDRIEELEARLADAAEMVIDWGAYASEYFQDKWNLEGDTQTLLAAALGEEPPDGR